MVRRKASLGLLLAMFAGSALASDVRVEVGHARLDPATVVVSEGDTVTFHNVDSMPGGHSVVADDGSFASPPLAKDERWSYTFDEIGVYPYHIKEHPGAKGKVTVE